MSPMPDLVEQRIRINGEQHSVHIRPGELLIDVIRNRFGLRGTKLACGRGECGACTVLIGGYAAASCIALAIRVDEVTTIEGLVVESQRLREAFADAGAFQCGFCTPGYIVRGVELLRGGVPADDRLLRKALSGNVCRCTGYQAIIEAFRKAAGT